MDARCHLIEVAHRFDLKEFGHGHAAHLTDHAHVVANEVHDHDVFCPILRVVLQRCMGILVFGQGAFHGLGHELTLMRGQKPLWRKREQRLVLHGQVSSEPSWLAGSQAPIERQCTAVPAARPGKGVVELIKSAFTDLLVNGRNVLREGLC